MVVREKVMLNDELENMEVYIPEGQFSHIILSEYCSNIFADEIASHVNERQLERKKEMLMSIVEKAFKTDNGGTSSPEEFLTLLLSEMEEITKQKFAEQFSMISAPYTSTLSLVYGFNYVKLEDVYTNLRKHFGDSIDDYAKEHLNTNEMMVFDLMPNDNDLEKIRYLTQKQYDAIYKQWLKKSIRESSHKHFMDVMSKLSEEIGKNAIQN